MRLIHLAAAAALAATAVVVPVASAQAAPRAGTCTITMMQQTADGGVATVPASGTQANPSLNCYLNRGSSGAAVKALQTGLAKCYKASIKADGVFGPGTRSALMKAQSAAKLKADGVYGANTMKKLKWPAAKGKGFTCSVLK